MRKVLALIALVVVIGTMNACKTHEKCPAYGKAEAKKDVRNS